MSTRAPFEFVYLAVDELKVARTQDEKRLNSPKPTYTSGRTENDT